MATINSISNKTGPLTITDSTDTTKAVSFVVSGVSAATTRTLTIDDRNVDFDAVPTSITTDSGSCVPAAGVFSVLGAGSVSTAGSGSAITVTGSGGAATCGFLVYLSSQASNVTGNNGGYDVVFNAEVFDIGNDVASGVFTAPSTGKYFLQGAVGMGEIDAGGTFAALKIVTSNKTYFAEKLNVVPILDGSGDGITLQGSLIVDMDQSDTATINVQVIGMAGDTVDVGGSSSPFYTWFSGWLMG